jgi:hypothetical protein
MLTPATTAVLDTLTILEKVRLRGLDTRVKRGYGAGMNILTRTVIKASELDNNASIYKVGSREVCEAYAFANAWRTGILAVFEDGLYCWASRPQSMR